MIRRFNKSKYAHIISLVFGAMLLVNCSGSEQQQQQEDLDASEEEEAANVSEEDMAANMGNQQFADDEDFSANEGQTTNNAGEEISNNQLANLTNDAGAQAPINNAALNAEAAPMNAAITNAAPMNAAPMNAAAPVNPAAPMADVAAPVDPVTAAASPTDRGIVKYVRSSGLSIVDQPGSTTVSGTLDQGDHPVVWENGEWARLSNGKYVSSKGLSEKGVGRVRGTNPWR